MTIEPFLSLLQFSDGLFPAGAYVHSFGLEYYVQTGQVTDAEGVCDFIRTSLEGSVGTTDVIVMLSALRCGFRNGDLDALLSRCHGGRAEASGRTSQREPANGEADDQDCRRAHQL